MAKTSLEKSHSKASNAKLTFLCMLASIFTSGVFACLALFKGNFDNFGIIICCIGGGCLLLSIICLLALRKFTR